MRHTKEATKRSQSSTKNFNS